MTNARWTGQNSRVLMGLAPVAGVDKDSEVAGGGTGIAGSLERGIESAEFGEGRHGEGWYI